MANKNQITSRLIYIGYKSFRPGKDGSTGREWEAGESAFGIDPDSRTGKGYEFVSITRPMMEFFPRAMAIYECTYEPRNESGLIRLVLVAAEYLEEWSPLPVEEPLRIAK